MRTTTLTLLNCPEQYFRLLVLHNALGPKGIGTAPKGNQMLQI